jgi:ATP-dependent Clp protease ATP-binding subunit ClpC
MFDRMRETAKSALLLARQEATHNGHRAIQPEDLLIVIATQANTLASTLISEFGATAGDIRREILARTGVRSASAETEVPFSEETKRTLEFATDAADSLSHSYIDTEHLLLGLLRDPGTVAYSVLSSRGLNYTPLKESIRSRSK